MSVHIQRRNVVLQDFDGNTLAGFWQYGSTSWTQFSTWLDFIIETEDQAWEIFDLDPTRADRHGAQKIIGPLGGVVDPGNYILLHPDGSPMSVSLTQQTARHRQPTHFSTPESPPPQQYTNKFQLNRYHNRVRDRDGKSCLITGCQYPTWIGLDTTHIFPRVHVDEWLRNGYHHLITDSMPAESIGGQSKIDSIQNVIMMRSHLHYSWDNYNFGVDPDNNYCVTPFVNGFSDVAGNVLQLGHITDSTVRPIDQLFRDHLLQGILRHVKGLGDSPGWDYEIFGDAFDLSRQDLWGNSDGKTRLELALADRLFEYQAAQQLEGEQGKNLLDKEDSESTIWQKYRSYHHYPSNM